MLNKIGFYIAISSMFAILLIAVWAYCPYVFMKYGITAFSIGIIILIITEEQ